MRGVLIGMVFLVVGGCDRASWMVDGGACPNPPVADAAGGPDMASPAPKCAAAKGLAGDNLLCVDFKDVQQLTSLNGWDFFCGGGYSWTSSGGFLQVNNFSTFQDECTAKLPAINLNDSDKQKYKSVILSIIHRVDLDDPRHNAYIYINDTIKQSHIMYTVTGNKEPARQQSALSMDRVDFPGFINSSPQWILKIVSSMAVSKSGWQIESIAINGIP